MCEIAPFCMKCEWEDAQDKLVMCKANKLHFAFRELSMSLPIVGGLFAPYKCKGFEIPFEALNIRSMEQEGNMIEKIVIKCNSCGKEQNIVERKGMCVHVRQNCCKCGNSLDLKRVKALKA